MDLSRKIKIVENPRIAIKILLLVDYDGGLISDDYVIKIIINVLPGTSLGQADDCEFWTIKTLMADPGRWRGNKWEPGPDCEATSSASAPWETKAYKLLHLASLGLFKVV